MEVEEFHKVAGKTTQTPLWNTLYIDDLRIDDQSSMLASSFLSKSTIEIDDPTVSRPDF